MPTKPPKWSKTARTRLDAALRALGWSQAELARRIEKNPTYLCRVLAGQITSRPMWALAWETVSVAMATSIGKPGAESADIASPQEGVEQANGHGAARPSDSGLGRHAPSHVEG